MKPFENVKSGKPIVYVREADREALPDHLKNAPGKFFSLHDPEGNQLALTEDRSVAFALARKNDLIPVSTH
ncbi:MAG: DUF1150 family protein [Paracoccaceae bacterium]